MRSFEFDFSAIGTTWKISCYEVNSKISQDILLSKIKDRIEIFDKTYSRFRKDSLVWKISQKKGIYEFPKDSRKLFTLYEKLYKITDGAFTLLIGQVLDEAGYDSSYSLIPRKINKVPDVSSIYSFEYPNLLVRKPYILDFGGLGKGYLVDIIGEILIENGIESFCIDGSGDIFYKSRTGRPLRVGLENPKDFKQVIGVSEILNQSICASAGSRRKWDKFHHIINPKTLSSPTSILSTWVVAKDALTADALATCLFLAPKEKLEKYFQFESVILYSDFSIDKSKGFTGQFFIKRV